MTPTRQPTVFLATFLVEHYWPGVTVETFTDAAGRVHASMERLRREGAPIRAVASTLVPADEAAYWVVDAPSAGLVERAFGHAAVAVERIVEAIEVRPEADAMPTRLRTVAHGTSGSATAAEPVHASTDIASVSLEGEAAT